MVHMCSTVNENAAHAWPYKGFCPLYTLALLQHASSPKWGELWALHPVLPNASCLDKTDHFDLLSLRCRATVPTARLCK